jgi:hypothetical protein
MILALVIACTSSCITSSPARKPYAYLGNAAVMLLGLAAWSAGRDNAEHGGIPSLQGMGITAMLVGGAGILINASDDSGDSPPRTAKKEAKRKQAQPEPAMQAPPQPSSGVAETPDLSTTPDVAPAVVEAAPL